MASVEFLTKFLVFRLLICIFVAKKCVDMRKVVCVLLVMLMPAVAFAGDGEGKQRPWLLKGLYWVKTLIDSSAVAGKDRSYIEQLNRMGVNDLIQIHLDAYARYIGK